MSVQLLLAMNLLTLKGTSNMAFYKSAGWKFWLAIAIEYALVIGGIMCENTWVLGIGMLLAIPIYFWSIHIAVCDNKSGGIK